MTSCNDLTEHTGHWSQVLTAVGRVLVKCGIEMNFAGGIMRDVLILQPKVLATCVFSSNYFSP